MLIQIIIHLCVLFFQFKPIIHHMAKRLPVTCSCVYLFLVVCYSHFFSNNKLQTSVQVSSLDYVV